MRKWIKRMLWMAVFAALAALGLIFFAAARIRSASEGRRFARAEEVPAHRAALVLGCVPILPNGRTNLYFRYRVEAAAALYHAGRVEHLLVSGDNHRHGYDEPTDMKNALMAAGVPGERITCDYAGFRTLDSVIRAKKVFGLDAVVIVSQPFHNDRAIYLARATGLDAVGFDARDVHGRYSLWTRAREHLARVAAVLDTSLLRRQPRFLGPRVELGSQGG